MYPVHTCNNLASTKPCNNTAVFTCGKLSNIKDWISISGIDNGSKASNPVASIRSMNRFNTAISCGAPGRARKSVLSLNCGS